MSQYVEYVADRLLVDLGYSKIFETKNPFQWMELLSQRVTANFFESKPAEYSLCSGAAYGEDCEF